MTSQPSDSPPWHIGDAAKRTQLSIRTIRHYDEIGLVVPSGRSEGGFRLYTQADVDRLLLIRRMKPLGFTLDEMAELLSIADAHQDSPTSDTSAALASYVILATERRAHLAQQLASVDDFISQLQRVEGADSKPLSQRQASQT